MPNLPVCHCGKKPNCFSREEFKGVIIASSYSWARAPGWAGPGSILQGWRNWGSSEGALGAWGSPSDFLGKEVKPVPTKVCAPPYLQIFRHHCRLLWAWCTLSKNLNFTITLPTTMASLLETCLDLYNCRNLDLGSVFDFLPLLCFVSKCSTYRSENLNFSRLQNQKTNEIFCLILLLGPKCQIVTVLLIYSSKW